MINLAFRLNSWPTRVQFFNSWADVRESKMYVCRKKCDVTRYVFSYTNSKEPCKHSKEPYTISKEPLLSVDVCDMTPRSWMRVTWPIHMCDMISSCVWHDSFICVTWLIHMCDMAHSCMWNDSFICVKWLIHMCDMTHSYVWHEIGTRRSNSLSLSLSLAAFSLSLSLSLSLSFSLSPRLYSRISPCIT